MAPKFKYPLLVSMLVVNLFMASMALLDEEVLSEIDKKNVLS
jgi:hypothetical protein